MSLRAPHWPRMSEGAPKRDYIADNTFGVVLAELSQPYRAVALAAFWTACRKGEIRV